MTLVGGDQFVCSRMHSLTACVSKRERSLNERDVRLFIIRGYAGAPPGCRELVTSVSVM